MELHLHRPFKAPLTVLALGAIALAAVACSSNNNNGNKNAGNAASSAATTVAATRAATASGTAAPAAAGSPLPEVTAPPAGVLPPGGNENPSSLTMAFVPSRDISQIQLSADKIAQYLSKELNRPVRSVTLTSYAAVSQALTAKNADLAWVGPLDYLISHEQNGAYPITCSVRSGARGYHAFIITRSDSGINTVAQLKGKSMALGDVVSASSSLMPRYALMQAGVDPNKDVKTVNISNQSAIAVAVYQGKADAGAIYDDARKNTEVISQYSDILDKTKVIWTSPLIPCDPQIVRKDLSTPLVTQIQAALLKLSNDPDGKTWLKDLFTIDSLSTASDADYNGLRTVVRQVQPDLLKGYPTVTATSAAPASGSPAPAGTSSSGATTTSGTPVRTPAPSTPAAGASPRATP